MLVPTGKGIGIERLAWHIFRYSYRSMLAVCGSPIDVQQKVTRHDGKAEGIWSCGPGGFAWADQRESGSDGRFRLAWGYVGF